MDSILNYDSGEPRPVVGQPGPQGRILSCTDSVQSPEVLEVSLTGTDLSVSGSAVWPVVSAMGLHQGVGTCHCSSQEARDPDLCPPGYSDNGAPPQTWIF